MKNCLLEGTTLPFDFRLQHVNCLDQLLRPRWATRNVNVNRNVLIDSLDDGVIIENSSRSGASSHRDDPFGFGHLRIEPLNYRRHLLRNATGNNHQVSLTWRTAKNFGAKPRQVEARGTRRHHLDSAAGQAKSHRPDGGFTRPIHRFIKLGEKQAVITGLIVGRI